MKSLSLERFIRILTAVAAVILVLFLIYQFSTLVIYALVALVFSYILDPYVNRMQAAGLPRVFGITIAISIVFLLIYWVSTTVFPAVASQVVDLAQQLSGQNIQSVGYKLERRIINYLPFLPDGFLENALVGFANSIFEFGDFQNTVSNVLGLFANVFYAVIVIPFSTFFFLKDGTEFRKAIFRPIPNTYFEITLSIIDKIEQRLGMYFKSVGVQSIIIGFTSWLLLTIIGLDNALAVAVVVGVANIIPYFGPAMGYLLSTIVAIFETGDFTLVLPAILAIGITQVLDNAVVQPFVFSKSTDLHPIVILFVVLIGAELGGIIGMLVAIPLATVFKILFREISWSLKNYRVFQTTNMNN
jgi:predicted PurR-regulated permease PerM